ncbi:endonuclease V, partial [Streptomyces sp. 7G]|uniref:endonuclease V n=1 Tax=Streptomyces sp. 7G TaxID=2877241 RepID=UPI001CD58188
AEGRAIQDRLRDRVILDEAGPEPGTGLVTGVDVAYDDEKDVVGGGGRGGGGAARGGRGGGAPPRPPPGRPGGPGAGGGPAPAPGGPRGGAGPNPHYPPGGGGAGGGLPPPTLETVEEATAVGTIAFPYVPGLLAFREIPTVLKALEELSVDPGLVVCDGYGLAHPRRFGLASHLGVLTGLPVIGVGKNPFTFTYEAPGPLRGASSPLLDGDEVVGRALRTRENTSPVFVSVGHRISLDNACAHTLRLAGRYRQPESTRRADALCRQTLREATA